MNKDIKIYGAMGAAERAMSMAAPTGTISWFSISEGALPPIGAPCGHVKSDPILLTNGQFVDFGRYWHNINTWVHESESYWEPTHWAYINYPL